MIQILVDNPLLTLFVIAALSYPLGRLRVGGASLGVAAVLFVGLAVGALDPAIQVPEVLWELGLVVFVYTIGLSSAPGFFASFRRKGLRDNLFVIALLVTAGATIILAARVLDLEPALAAGLFAGSLTNTPALAGLLELVRESAPTSQLETLLAVPVVGYSVAYPMGVLGMILVATLAQRRWKIDFAAEARALQELQAATQQLFSRTYRVTRPDVTGIPLRELTANHGLDMLFGRIGRGAEMLLAGGESRLALGDLVSVIGSEEQLDHVGALLGEPTDAHLEFDRTNLDFRRVFVSNPELVGHRLRDLNLPQNFGAMVTRLRRGDVDMLAHGDTQLELGDRVRVVTRRENMEAVSRFFGDSYRSLSEIDVLTFNLGLGLGILLGLLPFPLPGGATFRLGLAGGPLLVALFLGWRRRTGPLVWALPYSANLTLRQVGLVLFLAGIGTRAGFAFFSTVASREGLLLFALGSAVTVSVGLLTLWVGHRLLGIPLGVLLGMMAGLQTQPAVLGFALEQTGNDLPNIGYATVFPIATIGKILIAQLILIGLS